MTLEAIANAVIVIVLFCDDNHYRCERGADGWAVYLLRDGAAFRDYDFAWIHGIHDNKPTHPTDEQVLRLVTMANSPDDIITVA